MIMTEIPLTEEILYKNTYDEKTNSYKVYNTEHYIQYCLSNNYVIKYWKNVNKFTYEGLPLKYVSDLQLLFKLMRLNKEVIV